MPSDPDPDRLIYDVVVKYWTIPTWVEPGLRSRCSHCHIKFSSGHKHNCRLCGDLYCSACTAKYHVPINFEKKGKAGAVRVCLSCRDKAVTRMEMDEKDQGLQIPSPRLMRERTTSFSRSLATGTIIIHPPEWVALNTQKDCFKCRTPFKKRRHHCRTCGRLYCGNCSSKMDIPEAFKKKKKPGPARVCDMCRYIIVKGAELCEDTAPIPLPPPMEPEEPPAPPPMESDEYQSQATPTSIKVCWEGSMAPLTVLHDLSENASLQEVHEYLIYARPELKSEPFTFLCRGKTIWKEHWDIFRLEHLCPCLSLRPDTSHISLTPRTGQPSPRAADIVKHTRNLSSFRKVKKDKTPYTPRTFTAVALYKYKKEGDDTHLVLTKGQAVEIVRKDNDQWWFGRDKETGTKGWFPASYVRMEDSSSAPTKKSDHGGDDDGTPLPSAPREEKKKEDDGGEGEKHDRMVDEMFSDTDSAPDDDGSIMSRSFTITSTDTWTSEYPHSQTSKAQSKSVLSKSHSNVSRISLPPPVAPVDARKVRKSPRKSLSRSSLRSNSSMSVHAQQSTSDLNDIFKERAKLFR